MNPIPESETKLVCGVTLRSDPAREDCYQILNLHRELEDIPLDEDTRRRERIYRDYNAEIQTLEIASACIVDFPETPWELRLELARQCWDEARHAAVIGRLLHEIGTAKGEFP